MRKLWITFLVLIVAAASISSDYARVPKTWVVWPGSSIQDAIEQSRDGDTVLIQPGHYPAGLDFQGKAITVRGSQAGQVILDASGQAWIVRFRQDEGPESVMENVSIIPGGQTFELSSKARPTTRGIKMVGASLEEPIVEAPGEYSLSEAFQMAVAASPRMAWNGLNPFYQPAQTTAYTGSGDANRDGQISLADVSLVQQMVNGQIAPLPEADVDGNGSVTGADTALLQQSVDDIGIALPGWWNQLTTPAQRNSWVDRVLALDPTDKHLYLDWFLCYDFAVQTYANLAFDRADLSDTLYSGGQTAFNLPVYVVGVDAPGFGHVINAILVGDDPLDFRDWRIFEPQDDTTIIPGNWDMPYGARLSIDVYDQLGSNHASQTILVTFQVDLITGEVSLVSYNPNLTKVRPVPPSPSVQDMDNRPDAFGPQIIPYGWSGSLLYERQRDDLSRVTDLHLTSLPLNGPNLPNNQGLVQDAQFSRLLDWTKGPDGQIYLLWMGKPDYAPGLFYGQLDPIGGGRITGVSRVANVLFPREGRLVIRPNGEVLAIWYVNPSTRDDPSRGIYWSRMGSGGWESPQNLTPGFAYLDGDWPGWVRRDFFRYMLDTAVSPSGQVTLAWLEQVDETNQAIQVMDYEGSSWSSKITIDTTNARGLALAGGADSSLHLVYWVGKLRDQYDEEGRGPLIERIRTGSNWGPPTALDSAGSADCCLDLAAGVDGTIGMAWERRVGGQVVPIWRRYQYGSWGEEQVLPIPDGTNAWYPQLTWLPNVRIGLTWSLRSDDLNALAVWEEAGKVFLPAIVN
jgi:hypothetical protein